MADETIDDLLKALRTIQSLEATMRKHEQVLSVVLERLTALDNRLASVEAARRP